MAIHLNRYSRNDGQHHTRIRNGKRTEKSSFGFYGRHKCRKKRKKSGLTIADLYISREVADKKDSQLRTLLDVTDKDVETYYTYDYDEKEERARFVFFAPPQLVSKMMRIIK